MLRKIVFAWLLLCFSHASFGQVKSTTLQSVFIYSAIRYMEWPDNGLNDFTIVVLGESALYDELIKVSQAKKAGNRSIVVNKIDALTEVPKCHILFVTPNKINLLKKITDLSTKNPMLVITDDEGALDHGSDLNFIQRSGKVTFQINEKAIIAKNIRVSTNFTSLAATN